MTITTTTSENGDANNKKGVTALFTPAALTITSVTPVVAFVFKQGLTFYQNIMAKGSKDDLWRDGSIMWIFQRGSSNVGWCEDVVAAHDHNEWIAEFYNTISNLTFIAAGVLGLKRFADSHSKSSKEPPLPGSFAIAELIMLVGVGFGSALFHAHQSRFAQLADELPMSALMIASLHCCKGCHPLTTNPDLKKQVFHYYHAVIGTLWALYLYTHIHDVFLMCFLLQVTLHLFVSYDGGRRMRLSHTKWWVATALIIVGKVCWNMERHRFETGKCNDDFTMVLHPVWHIASGMSHYYSMAYLADLVYVSSKYESIEGFGKSKKS